MQGVQLKTAYDQMGCEVKIPRKPRIISLVPSQTELLFDLGLKEQIIGVTKFCVHPHSGVKEKVKIGGTKKFNFEVIDNLQPDLIIGNKEENYKEGIEKLKEKYPVWMSDIVSLHDAFEMIVALGRLTDKEERAEGIKKVIAQGFDGLGKLRPRRTLYLIWQKPYMVVGASTFIDEIMNRLGLKNLASDLSRYPELSRQDIVSLQPDLILLSSEPYPFKEKHISDFQVMCPDAEVKIVDGEMFSWYGSRLVKATKYFDQLQF